MKTLNIIGAGRVGQTLAALWHAESVFKIGAVCCRDLDNAKAAVEFIQAGTPFGSNDFVQLPPADVWLLTCHDDGLEDCCNKLLASGVFESCGADVVVFHCSGALTAQEVLQSVGNDGVHIASVHPIKSFATSALAVNEFAGTFCGVEGAVEALDVLVPAFTAIGAKCFDIKPEAKTLYHAASVIACNYLVALQELSVQTFEQAGVTREQSMAILKPIVEGTVNNVFKMGTTAALTGPIARGDIAVVQKQFHAIQDWNADYAVLYQGLGNIAFQLAQQQK